jgi:hypothetical protein
LAIVIAANVSVSEPTWLILTRIEFATRFAMPCFRIFVFVQKLSSPTSC